MYVIICTFRLDRRPEMCVHSNLEVCVRPSCRSLSERLAYNGELVEVQNDINSSITSAYEAMKTFSGNIMHLLA